jgi:hypothetical protein
VALASSPRDNPSVTDARDTINQPMTDALDGIVFRAVLSFVAVAIVTAVPLLLHLPPGIHAAAHAVLPASWVIYAVVTLVRVRGVPEPAGDPWKEGAEADPGAARAARIAYLALPVGWLAAAAGLLAHHLGTTPGTAEVLGIDVPVLGVAWFAAIVGWRASTRAVLAVAGEARGQRLRDHMAGLRDTR